jgi:hypothetical protein
MVVDARVGDFLAKDITWRRRIGIQSLAAEESKPSRQGFHTLPIGHEVVLCIEFCEVSVKLSFRNLL